MIRRIFRGLKMKQDTVIVKVWKATRADRVVKMITVPLKCDIQDGDYVKLVKVE